MERFSEGRESVTDEERSGRPATSRTEENITKIHQIVHENHMFTPYHHLAPELGMNGATPLLPLYAFIAWAGTPLLVPLTLNKTTVMIRRCPVSYKVILSAVNLGYEFR